jgi:hypothetical protein
MFDGEEVSSIVNKWRFIDFLSFFPDLFSQRHDVDVLFQAKTWARSREGPENGPKFLIFDVVMEENVMGIPVSALPLVAAAVVLVAVSPAFFLF